MRHLQLYNMVSVHNQTICQAALQSKNCSNNKYSRTICEKKQRMKKDVSRNKLRIYRICRETMKCQRQHKLLLLCGANIIFLSIQFEFPYKENDCQTRNRQTLYTFYPYTNNNVYAGAKIISYARLRTPTSSQSVCAKTNRIAAWHTSGNGLFVPAMNE